MSQEPARRDVGQNQIISLEIPEIDVLVATPNTLAFSVVPTLMCVSRRRKEQTSSRCSRGQRDKVRSSRLAGDVVSRLVCISRKHDTDNCNSDSQTFALLYVPDLDRCTEILIQFGTSFEWPVRQPAGKRERRHKQLVTDRAELREKKNAACDKRSAARWVYVCFEVDSVLGERIARNCHSVTSRQTIIRHDSAFRYGERGENHEFRRLCSVRQLRHNAQLTQGTVRNSDESALLNAIFNLKFATHERFENRLKFQFDFIRHNSAFCYSERGENYELRRLCSLRQLRWCVDR